MARSTWELRREKHIHKVIDELWDLFVVVIKENRGMCAERFGKKLSMYGTLRTGEYIDFYVTINRGEIFLRVQDQPYKEKENNQRSLSDNISDTMKGIDALKNCYDGDCGNCDACDVDHTYETPRPKKWWIGLRFSRGDHRDGCIKFSNLELTVRKLMGFKSSSMLPCKIYYLDMYR